MKTQLQNSLVSLKSSYWFIPCLLLLAAFGLSFLTQQLDSRYRFDIAGTWPGVFQGGPEGAWWMLATIAGSMITAAAVTFSITIAALANASSQFGSRLLRIFMQDIGSQVVLGTLLGTFVYCLMALRLVPVEGSTGYVPHLSTMVALALAVVSIGALVYFIHHMASMLQLSHVTAVVGNELLAAIGRLFPEDLGWGAEPDGRVDAISLSSVQGGVLPDGNGRNVQAERIGYIQAIDVDALMELTSRHEVVVRLALRPGVFVVPDALIAVVWPAERATVELRHDLQHVFIVGSRRTTYQDIELYFDELIEIAMRALSPGINDPYSAFTCIDWLTAGLTSLAQRRLPSRYRYDGNGRLRIIADGPHLVRLLERVFDRIRNAGAGQPSVLLKLFDAALTLAPLLRSSEEHAALRQQLQALEGVVRSSSFVPHERRELSAGFREAIQALNATS